MAEIDTETPEKEGTMRIETASRGRGDGTDPTPLELCGAELDSDVFGPVKCRKRPGHTGMHKWWNHAKRATIWSDAMTDNGVA